MLWDDPKDNSKHDKAWQSLAQKNVALTLHEALLIQAIQEDHPIDMGGR
jgi:hypothetical protein